MTPVDRAILERLKNEGNAELVLAPRPISDNTDYARSTVRRHLLELKEHGLVEYYDESASIYKLTDLGRAYLKGLVDADELEDDKE